jgi:hypothetical protein
MTGFAKLPPELRLLVLRNLLSNYKRSSDRGTLSQYASICREWQAIVEQYSFSELYITLLRLPKFAEYVQNGRRRCVKRIRLHVELPHYANDPCEVREGWEDKMKNNEIFTATFRDLFNTLSEWKDEDVCKNGIQLFFSISSCSDLRNTPPEIWQRRRWNSRDIGEKRFGDSVIDFIGQDEEFKRIELLKPVHAITSFQTCPLNRRAIMPMAYSDIIAKLPRLKQVSLGLIRERRLQIRRAVFDSK